MTRRNEEFDNFDRTMRQLVRVPHSKIKAKLDAEKEAKKRKSKRTPRDSSGREGA